MELTKENGQILDFFDHDFQHRPRDVFDVIVNLHLDQPIKNFLLGIQVSVVQVGNFLFEENQSRKFLLNESR
jgi:hypothetical protein